MQIFLRQRIGPQINRSIGVLLVAMLFTGCSIFKMNKQDGSSTSSIQVNSASIGRNVLISVPIESAMERFAMVDREGRKFSYVAFTDTDYGGLLFLNNRLYGAVSKRDALAFYSCRGYISATQHYWASDASDWIDSLMKATIPETRVTLKFTRKSAMQRVEEASSNPMLSTVNSLVNIGTNPFSIFRTLNMNRNKFIARENLNNLMPGDSESKLAKIVRPEDVSFTSNGIVMAYPSFLQDFYVNDGIVKVQQQPSFYQLSHRHAAVFYVRDMHWDKCNPKNWRQAMPPDWKSPAPDEQQISSITADKTSKK